MRKFFLIGSSSYLLQTFEKLLVKESFKVVSISRKKPKKIIKNLAYYLTDYSENSLEEIFEKEIVRSNCQPILIFGNVITQSDLFIHLKNEKIEDLININIKLPIKIIKIILSKFLRLKPIFFNFSSIRTNPGIGYSLYGSSKVFMENFFKNLAMEYGNLDCIFKSISVGISSGGLGKKLEKKTIQEYVKRSSIRKPLEPKEIFDTLIFELDKKSSNGKVIYCDNGYF